VSLKTSESADIRGLDTKKRGGRRVKEAAKEARNPLGTAVSWAIRASSG
jgi:hypothetical protein